MAEVYSAINTLQERVLTAQNNVKRGLGNIATWGDIPLHNRKFNPDKMELLAVNERQPRFIKRSIIISCSRFIVAIMREIFVLFLKKYIFLFSCRRNNILQSHAEFQDILKENFKLFFNIQDDVEVFLIFLNI